MNRTVEIPVVESSQVGEARRFAARVGGECSLGESDTSRAALIATELGTNLVKHAGGGSILFRCESGSGSFDLLALDRGPGVQVGRAMQDGYSTAGSPGNGLGAVQRQADLLEIHSNEGKGTVILARVVSERGKRPAPALAGISLPYAGETDNGDGWVTAELDGGATMITLIDGLGHGTLAADAARAGCDVARRYANDPPAALARRIHEGLRGTRGAAIGVTRIDRRRGELVFCGAGNIAGTIVGPTSRRSIVSMHGIAGHQVNDFREFRYELATGSLVLLHSDGISSKWDLGPYGAVHGRDLALIAGLVWRDFRRTNDDATLVVARV